MHYAGIQRWTNATSERRWKWGGVRQNKMKLPKSFVLLCVFKGPTRVFVPWKVRKSSLKQHYFRHNRRQVCIFQGLYASFGGVNLIHCCQWCILVGTEYIWSNSNIRHYHWDNNELWINGIFLFQYKMMLPCLYPVWGKEGKIRVIGIRFDDKLFLNGICTRWANDCCEIPDFKRDS